MKYITIVTVICLAALAGCAAKDEIVSLDSRMSEIEMREAEERKKRKELLESTQGSDQALRQQSASIRAQIEELREEVRLLNGRLDEIDYAIKQQDGAAAKSGQAKMDELEQLANNNNDRLKKLEQYLNLETAAAGTAPVVAAKPSSKIKAGDQAPKPSSEKDVYNAAKLAFDQGELENARKGFEGFIKRFPRSENADNAQFWIGEIYYRDKWYEKAILEYQKVIENYPKGNKVPASLLKQGLAFLNIGDKDNSRLILQELIRKYPKSNEANIAAEKLKTLK